MGVAIKVNKMSGTQVYVDNSLYAGSRLNITNCELPYCFIKGSMVVYDGEIHILGGEGNGKKHYKYNGTSWEEVSTLPYSLTSVNAVAHNDAIYYVIFAKMYKWDGEEWTQLDDAPFSSSQGSLLSYNNELHFLNWSTVNKQHYKWDGSSWSLVSTLPYQSAGTCAVVYDNEIHMMGGTNASNYKNHYKWDGTSWTQLPNLSRPISVGNAVVSNNKIYYFTHDESYFNEYYTWDGTESTLEGVSKISSIYGCVLAHSNKIYLAGGWGAPFMMYQLGKQLLSSEQVV